MRLLYDSHSHTPLCRHATGLPEEYARVAHARGLKGMIVTCHNPMPEAYGHNGRMREEEFPEYLRLVSEAAAQWADRDFEILLGLESDYLPGFEGIGPWLEAIHSRAEFHYILGSIHPQLSIYLERFSLDHPREFQRGYFEHLAQAAESGFFDAISHPDLVKNLTPDTWNVAALMPDIRRSLDRIAATGVAMELNTSGLLKTVPEMNPGPEILREMNLRGIPVVLGSDAHVPERAGENFPLALRHLKAAGYREIHLFRHRRPRALAIDEVEATLISPAS